MNNNNNKNNVFTENEMKVSTFVQFLYSKLKVANFNPETVIDFGIPNVKMTVVFDKKNRDFCINIAEKSFKTNSIKSSIELICDSFKVKDTREYTVETVIILPSNNGDHYLFVVCGDEGRVKIPSTNMEIYDTSFKYTSLRGVKESCGVSITSSLVLQCVNKKNEVVTNFFVVPTNLMNAGFMQQKKKKTITNEIFGFMPLTSKNIKNVVGYQDNKSSIDVVIGMINESLKTKKFCDFRNKETKIVIS